MWSKKDVLIFFAGALACHTLSHLTIQFTQLLPIQLLGFTLTYNFNIIVIIVSLILTLALIWWASRVK